MDPTTNPKGTQELDARFQERFEKLPKVVQDAITSADVTKRLRALAETHKLHIDQWEVLENEVKLTLYGFEQAENLEKNIRSELGVGADIAHALAESINTIVFEPVREELERQLTHPDAKTETESDVEASRTQILGSSENSATPAITQPPAITPTIPVVAPATPPQPAPATPVVRMPASGDYKPGVASTERASVVDDPYREPPK